MARRKQKHLIDPKLAFGLLISVGIIWLLVQILQQLSRGFGNGIGIVVLLGGAAALGYFRPLDGRRKLLDKSQAIVDQQINPLVRRRAQLVLQDAYGKPQREKWEKEKDHFITQHIEPLLSPSELRTLQRERTLIPDLIETCVEVAARSQPAFRNFSDDMTSTEFEFFCAEELRRAGWNARVTRQSRDQGVDVVAEKDNMRVVIQCKRYAGPVGNKAVQEVAAARAHEQARYGVVVTNSRYTPAAEQLASTNGILLLHYSELQNLHDLLSRGR